MPDKHVHQQAFDLYTNKNISLTIDSSETMEIALAGLIFRRWQNQQPLTMAEKLASYQSTTSGLAHDLEKHPIWNEYYLGPRNRKQVFQGCLCLIVLEVTQECVSMSAPRLKEYASGARDNRVTPELIQAITDQKARREGNSEYLLDVQIPRRVC